MLVGNSVGDTKFPYAMKLLLSEDLGFQEFKVSRCLAQASNMH